MNRVASVTLLKDATAKAIYGSKAANGVVVVETKRPQAGKLRATYTADLKITAPDLSSYRLTDASEKLQAEVNAGRYKGTFCTPRRPWRSSITSCIPKWPAALIPTGLRSRCVRV
ncbi:hypothetical protein MKQ70_07850 [Chitinophaga sedimenti]|uniref:hypothetical protein n=1 Tax=Chitinophaga sedimenti TaxID=2033606 RepID=UPI0020059076|nr:hypothetical protein [Chitinophaga sedimenti]MCK7554922.1 hypothetical protein [Chitinophaga sedimenti]